jgi:hypothetical protein
MTTKIIHKITFYDENTDKYYTTSEDFDHSLLCDIVDDEDLQEINNG